MEGAAPVVRTGAEDARGAVLVVAVLARLQVTGVGTFTPRLSWSLAGLVAAAEARGVDVALDIAMALKCVVRRYP